MNFPYDNFFLFLFVTLFFSSSISAQSKLPGTCGGDCADPKMIDMKNIPAQENSQTIRLRFLSLGNTPPNLDSLLVQNIASLNEAFVGKIIFEKTDKLIETEHEALLTDLYKSYSENNPIFDTLRTLSQKGYINVFLMPTLEDTVSGQVLLGFTPIFSDWFEGFKQVSPRMDNLFVSYDGLFKGTTLTHEMGHFFGLAHPFQLDFPERKELGLETEKAICTNFMNYNCFVAQFTKEQLNLMSYFSTTYRHYLQK